jgi:hypothetical protein
MKHKSLLTGRWKPAGLYLMELRARAARAKATLPRLSLPASAPKAPAFTRRARSFLGGIPHPRYAHLGQLFEN